MLFLLPQLMFLILVLVIDGEPFRYFFLRRLPIFADMDLIQICTVNIFVGAFAVYLLAILPVGLFNLYALLAFSSFCLFVSAYLHLNSLRSIAHPNRLKERLAIHRMNLLIYLLVFGMFLVILILQLTAVSNFVFGSILDESIHSLKVEVILENNHAPLTLQPYLAEGIIYPQASHVLFAFAYYVFGMGLTVPQVVFYVTILFKSLSVFGAYFLGRKLNSNRLYPVALAFIFAFVSCWPFYLSWGGNPFLIGFPLFLVDLGLFVPMARDSTRNSVKEVAAIGLMFGFTGAIIVSFTETLFVLIAIVFVYWLIRQRQFLKRKLTEYSALMLFSLAPLIPVFYSFLLFFSYPGHNIGLPQDFMGWESTSVSFTMTQALQWAFSNLSAFDLIRYLILVLIACSFILLYVAKVRDRVSFTVAFGLAVFVAATLLSILGFFVPSDLGIISWGHQGVIITASLSIFMLAFYDEVVQVCTSCKFRLLSKFSHKQVQTGLLSALVILASVNAPFVYFRVMLDPSIIKGGYGMFAVTTSSDYDLMMWMKNNLYTNGTILVSPYEPGLFIPSISHNKIDYPYAGSAFSNTYQSLVNLTCEKTLNDTSYDLLNKLSISYIYVGSSVAFWGHERQHKWDPNLFLGNPNFNLVKSFGNAYLFRYNYTNPNVSFYDDFQYEKWNEYGWQVSSYGHGLTNVAVCNASKDGSEKQLEMTSQAIYTITEQKSVSSILKEMYIKNESDVQLSFYLNATEGFHGNDTFAAIVSNVYRNQSVIITTPNGTFQSYSHLATLGSFEGNFQIDISAIWRHAYGSSFPTSFLLEFVNYDFDGLENVAYIDDVAVTSTSVIGVTSG